MASSLQSPSTTTSTLSFYVPPPQGVRAYLHVDADPITGEQEKNWHFTKKEVEIKNLRGKEDTVTLDTAGFQLFQRASKHKAFNNDAEIEAEYYPESIQYIKDITGASRVVMFDHTIRRRRPGEVDDGPARRQPVPHAHVDQTPISSVTRVHRHLPAADAPDLLKRRYQVINLWRPIGNPALDCPLALCDYRSVGPQGDVIPVTLINPDSKGEIYGVTYNPEQKWGYFRGMSPDEFVLIKCFDSIQDGSVAIYSPHTAFMDPTTPKDAPLRESIELRALVFYD